MKKVKVLTGLILLVVAALATANYASATPSASFSEVDGDVLDEWGIARTRGFGEDGFYQYDYSNLNNIQQVSFIPVTKDN